MTNDFIGPTGMDSQNTKGQQLCKECGKPLTWVMTRQDVPAPELSNYGHRFRTWRCKNGHQYTEVEEVVYD